MVAACHRRQLARLQLAIGTATGAQVHPWKCQRRREQAVEHRISEFRAAQQQLIRREPLAAICELSAKIVHEVRPPLSTMRMALDHLSQADLPETSSRRLALAQEKAGGLNRLLSKILNYATPSAGSRHWVDVNALGHRARSCHRERNRRGPKGPLFYRAGRER